MQLTALDGSPFDRSLIDGSVVLYVNVASECGLTPQYEQLQALYESRKDKGLVIVGVPCNQFGSQEPGSSEQIASFCKLNYGVTFPLLEKQEVNGDDRSPLYRYLVGSTAGGGGDIKWNFAKFLVDSNGECVGRYGPQVPPSEIEGDIVKLLDAQGPKLDGKVVPTRQGALAEQDALRR